MAMTSLNFSLPEAMKAFIESEVATGYYSTPSEYVRALVREAQERARVRPATAPRAEGSAPRPRAGAGGRS